MRLEPFHFRVGDWEVRANLCTEVGDEIPGHAHDHDHLTIIRRGRWLVAVDGKEFEVASPALSRDVLPECLNIAAGKVHLFRLLEAEKGVGALWCMWPDGMR